MTKILYLTFCEPVIGNGIYDTQVKQVLCQLATAHGGELTIFHRAILAGVEIGRRDIGAPFLFDRNRLTQLKNEYRQSGIGFRPVFLPIVVRKRWGSELPLPVLGFMLALSLARIACTILKERPDTIHCRSYVASLIAVVLKPLLPGLKVIFDPRGFWPEEGVVMQRWKEGSSRFRFWKLVEKFLLHKSDKVIALSDSFAKRIVCLDPQADCSIIYAGAKLEEFGAARSLRARTREALGLKEERVLVYNGSLHAWHDPIMLARLFVAMRSSFVKPKLLVISGYSQATLIEAFRSCGIDHSEFIVISAKAAEVPAYLAAADYGLVPLKEMPVRGAMSVVAATMIGTKVAEYLASGLPLIVNKQVGGLESLMANYKLGTFFDQENFSGLPAAIHRIEKHYSEYLTDCQCVARELFSVAVVARSYRSVYITLHPDKTVSPKHEVPAARRHTAVG